MIFCFNFNIFLKNKGEIFMDLMNANQLFFKLCSEYDLSDPNILRRFVHGMEAAQNCFSVACSEMLSKAEREFLYCVGLLHDVGRLEQWKNYANFSDTKTQPHEKIGAVFLKESGYIEKFFETKEKQKLALKLIEHHTHDYQGKDQQFKKFLDILRDADCYANLDYTASGLQRLWTTQNGVSSQVLAKFRLRQSLHGTPIRTKLDRVFQLLSRTYSIKHNILKRDLLARKYINAIYEVYNGVLNTEDSQILYKECWILKQELANEVNNHDLEKAKMMQG